MPLTQKQKKFIRKNYNNLTSRELSKRIQVDEKHVLEYVKKISTPRIDPVRLRIYRAILISVPILFLLFLEIGLRVFNYGGNLKLFIDAPGDYSEYKMVNPSVGRRYFFMQSTVPDPPNDIFLKRKPENGFRIFVLGGSTTAGYPYGNNLMFSRILNKRLSDTFPQKKIEVVNTAMTAINTYSLLDYMPEILKNQPDAILIYSGHNEFYGALGIASNESLGKFHWFVKSYLKLQHLKIFLLVRNAVAWAKNRISTTFLHSSTSNPSATLMERIVSKQSIPLNSPLYKAGRRQFERNLNDIFSLAQKASVPVIVSELVSNIKDQKPFISVATDSFPAADAIFNRATAEYEDGKYQAARKDFYRAKDLDVLRFRATEDFNRVVHQVANRYQIPVVPMKDYFEKASPNQIVGSNLMLDQLHPNLNGEFLMADAFYQTMRTNGFLESRWDSTRIKSASYYRQNWGFTELDTAYANLRIRVLKGGWPFIPKSVPNRAIVDYSPVTRAESLAIDIWENRKLDLERGHVNLAKYYLKKKEYWKALAEYKALVYLTPYNVYPYLEEANIYVKLQKFDRAMPILRQSLDLRETAFANKWIGQIKLNDQDIAGSLPYLEKAVKELPNDPQLLFNISGAYALQKQFRKAMNYLDRLKRIRPGYPGEDDLRRQLRNILDKKVQINERGNK